MNHVNRKIKKLLWEDWQIKTIRDLAGKVPIEEICETVGRTESAVRHKANLHGFTLQV